MYAELQAIHRKLCLFTKFPYQEIRLNFSILRSVLITENAHIDKAETCSGLCQLSIQDEAFGENSQQLLAVHYSRKTLHIHCLTGFWIRLWKDKSMSQVPQVLNLSRHRLDMKSKEKVNLEVVKDIDIQNFGR